VFDWLFEGHTSVYVVLAALMGFLLVAWWQTRKRWVLMGVPLVAALAGVYALLDVMVETDREQIVRKVNALVAALNAHNLDAAFVHVSDEFRSPAGKSKKEVRDAARMYFDQKIVERVKVWDIVCEGTPSRERPPARVFFSIKVEGFRDLFADCDATCDFHPEHGWRLFRVRLFIPQTTEEWPHQF